MQVPVGSRVNIKVPVEIIAVEVVGVVVGVEVVEEVDVVF